MGRSSGVGVVGLALVVAALAAVLALMVGGSRADAASAGADAAGGARHCVLTVKDSAAKKPERECFSSFRAAISDATGGRVTDAPRSASAFASNEAAQREVFAAGPSSSSSGDSGEFSTMRVRGDDVNGCCRILSVEYEHARFRGNTLTYRATRGCDRRPDVDLQIGYVGNKWNDEISSYVGSNRCQVKHFEHQNFRGSRTVFKTQDGYMGAFNDEASSIKWR